MHGLACGRRGTRWRVRQAQPALLLPSCKCWSERLAGCMQPAIEERRSQMHSACVFTCCRPARRRRRG